MRLSARPPASVCLPCRIRIDRECVPPRRLVSALKARRHSSHHNLPLPDTDSTAYEQFIRTGAPWRHRSTAIKKEGYRRTSLEHAGSQLRPLGASRSLGLKSVASRRTIHEHAVRRVPASAAPPQDPAIELSSTQRETLAVAHTLRQRLTRGLSKVPALQKEATSIDGLPIEAILETLPKDIESPLEQKLLESIGKHYAGKTFGDVKADLTIASSFRGPSQAIVTDPRSNLALKRLGLLAGPSLHNPAITSSRNVDNLIPINSALNSKSPTGAAPRPSLAAMVNPPPQNTRKAASRSATRSTAKEPSIPMSKTPTRTIAANDLAHEPIPQPSTIDLPQLSFGLSRVLFNPGVYHLRDPRSRVYNFDPYLEHVMPVTEFNFEALNPYLTSSEDSELLKLARLHGKRYSGSSSSMTSIFSQFHYLISQWRELNTSNFSRGFTESLKSFSAVNRSPAAIFLRYKNGAYAIDADKEYDEPNVLLSLGKSLEKLLTLEKDEFETWRRSATPSEKAGPENRPEMFHYTQQGRFLLRSQLDAWDPRLPGTGYFDLKSRAVVGVRMNLRDYTDGKGYEIKDRFGTWESYEREYYDMMRSTFLKYSLQARLGQMDGIFVAYHNVARIFGFQYISMPELDLALHGQTDSTIGDQEFSFSIKFLEEILNVGTEAFPERSLRVHFETREASVADPKPCMHVFLEPMDEDEIGLIQSEAKAQAAEFERNLFQRDKSQAATILESGSAENINEGVLAEEGTDHPAPLPQSTAATGVPPTPSPQTGPASNGANTAFLNALLDRHPEVSPNTQSQRSIVGLKLSIQNRINGRSVTRPEDINSAARWTIDYKLDQMTDDVARRMYTFCKSRRMAALRNIFNRGPDDYFLRAIRGVNAKGAEWRKQQDELDAQREKVVFNEKE